MTDNFTRRDALGVGLSAAALAATGMPAHAEIKAASVPAPALKIEEGASLKTLRPVRFVKQDEDVWRANAAKFTEKFKVPVTVDFVGWEDVNSQTAVTANTGAGPDLIVGFSDAPHIYVDKLIELTDVADYLGKRYGGWKLLAERYGKKANTNNWIALPFGTSAGPLIYRISTLKELGYDKAPNDHKGFLELCQKLHKAGKPSGFALGNAVGDANGFADWLLWSHGAALTDKAGNIAINSKETVAALEYLKELYQYFIPGTTGWNDVSNNRAYAAGEIHLTANGVSLYFSMKNDPKTAPIAEDSTHQQMPFGLAKSAPMSGITMNAMVFKHSKFPNASKAFLQFMLEHEQYDPWLNANSGYWSQPLKAYNESDVWKGDPKVAIYKDSMDTEFWPGYAGPISAASGSVRADFVLVQMMAAAATGASTPKEAAAEAERRAQRFYRR